MIRELIVIVCLTILLSSTALALTASISNPRMVLYKNITKGDILEFENYVFANNNNDFDVLINVEPISEWKDKIVVDEPEFVLPSGERKQINYTVTISEAGYYRGDILVSFHDAESTNTLSAAQDLVVLVADETGKVPNPGDPNAEPEETSLSWLWILIIAIIVVFILVVISANIRRKK